MPWFALRTSQTDYDLAPGSRLTTFRQLLQVDLGGRGWTSPYCFFDTGAPVSIISQVVAQRIAAHITPIPIQNDPIPVFENGTPMPSVPRNRFCTWWDPIAAQSIPCLLAELTVRFRNRLTGDVSNPLRLVAKILQGPALPFGGDFVLFGMHLLIANGGQLHVQAQQWNLGGPGLFFPP